MVTYYCQNLLFKHYSETDSNWSSYIFSQMHLVMLTGISNIAFTMELIDTEEASRLKVIEESGGRQINLT
jgi:hypothetical protein